MSHFLKSAQQVAMSQINVLQVSSLVFICFLAKDCCFPWDKEKNDSRFFRQKRVRSEFLVIGTWLTKGDYDLGLDESLQFLSSLGLITLNFPSLPSLAIFLWVLFVLLIVEYSTLFLLANCILWIVTSKDEHCWALERIVLQNTKKAFY